MGWHQLSICFILLFGAAVKSDDHKADIKIITALRDHLRDDMGPFTLNYVSEKDVYEHGKNIVTNLDEMMVVYRKDGKTDADRARNASSEIEEYNKLFEEYIHIAWKAFFRASGLIIPSIRALGALDRLERSAS